MTVLPMADTCGVPDVTPFGPYILRPTEEREDGSICRVAGVVRSTSTESHVDESDGSCASFGRRATFGAMEEMCLHLI